MQRSSVQEPAAEKSALSEIVVTAQKREERLRDVPVPVTAINAQALVDNNRIFRTSNTTYPDSTFLLQFSPPR